jgi:hypothetical protein
MVMKLIAVATLVIGGYAAMVAFLTSGAADQVQADDAIALAAVVDAQGNLHVPGDYREKYEFLGTWSVAADEAPGAAELHIVYASPGTIAAYRRDGRFPDRTVLVKEVHLAATIEMTTGTVSHPDSLKGWFVMVRDRNGRYSENDTWGDGWGWAWFDAGGPSAPSRNLPVKGGGMAATGDYRDNCKSCHSPAQATEWIYTEGYPPLKP